jgi:hypothetical protein
MAVPDTDTFSLEDVNIEIYGFSTENMSLQAAFDNADPALFDSNFNPNSLGFNNNLLNWRNYNFIVTTCGQNRTEEGGSGYPISQNTAFGNAQGTVTLDPTVGNVPDRFLVIWNGTTVIDTGYLSNDDVSYNQEFNSRRNNFKAALEGKTTPERSGTYPFPANSGTFPNQMASDGYPIVYYPQNKTFNKNFSESNAVVEVYGPMSSTDWGYTLSCPV